MPMDTRAYLEVRDVRKTFDGNTALGGISLSFAKGQFVTVLGPSGCGKTTLLALIAGIAAPDSGGVYLEGRDITHLPPEHRNFGMVFQNYALFPNLTVTENVTYGLFRLPKQEAAARAANLLEMTGLTAYASRYPLELSGGQRQRVALARAIATNPAVLLLDEPLSALDAQVRMTLGQELLRLQRETGITTIMVTHDQQEALALADRVVLMNEGAVVQDGTPATLYAEPATAFAAGFIGHMNALSMPALNSGRPVGIRFEEVKLAEPSEAALARENTWVGKVEHAALMGSFYRVTVLLNDFTTRIQADVPRAETDTSFTQGFAAGNLVAVTLPASSLRTWDTPWDTP
ncbi:MAG: Vitamin B12 import ATP-binding protein BtuD [Desulfovibrio sp.]